MLRKLLVCLLLGLILVMPAYAQTVEPVILDETVLALEADGHLFIGNRNSLILHIDTCTSLPKPKNQVALLGFADGLEKGFRPCGICLNWVEADGTTTPIEDALMSYIGNKNSSKFHSADCSSLPAEKNRIYFLTRLEAVLQGYSPCRHCKP